MEKIEYNKCHDGILSTIKNIYKILIAECFEEFRNFVYTHENQYFDDGTECPACFKMSPKVFSLDADFQLVRKHSSGHTWVAAKHEGHFFANQEDVDSFVNSYTIDKQKKAVVGDCNEFQAASNIRSKNTNSKLDETAVFGSVCRHEFPQMFFSLKHGERFSYAVFLIEKLLELHQGNIFITYDIACALENHLKKRQNDCLDKITLCLPAFHVYGHKMSCQIMYGPRRIHGLGLTDGESIERLWSYLGKFSNITKEATPENRIDILTDGLLHYGSKLKDKMGVTLVKKYDKSVAVHQSSSQSLTDLLHSATDSAVSISDVERWENEENDDYISTGNKNEILDLTVEEEYCLSVENLQKIKQNGENLKKINTLTQTVNKCKKKITVPDGSEFENTLDVAHDKKRRQVHSSLLKLGNERLFMLELVKKYSRGQAIAIRLSKQVKNINTKMKQSIESYNSIAGNKLDMQLTIDFPQIIEEVHRNNSSDVNYKPYSFKKEVIYLNLLKKRSKEETILVLDEMKCIINFYQSIQNSLIEYFSDQQGGMQSAVAKEGLHVEKKLFELTKIFKNYIGTISVNSYFSDLAKLNITDSVNIYLNSNSDSDHYDSDSDAISDYSDSDSDSK